MRAAQAEDTGFQWEKVVTWKGGSPEKSRGGAEKTSAGPVKSRTSPLGNK